MVLRCMALHGAWCCMVQRLLLRCSCALLRARSLAVPHRGGC
jgi:hypothetical protein